MREFTFTVNQAKPVVDHRKNMEMTIQGLMNEVYNLEVLARQGLLQDIVTQLQLAECKQRLDNVVAFAERQTLYSGHGHL